ncbi:MAG: SiaB family protein kinase [Crocinitomicaceae bacterium]
MVEISNDTAEILLKRNFDRTINGCLQDIGCFLLHDFLGNINETTIGQISSSVEQKLHRVDLEKNISKRAFAILIEGLQNIYRHALKDSDGQSVGGFVLTNSNENIQLHFLNLVCQDYVPKLKKYCERLNLMSHDEIKTLYMETLTNAEVTDKGGASLGCMLMKLKSHHNLSYNFELVEKEISCLHLIVSIAK